MKTLSDCIELVRAFELDKLKAAYRESEIECFEGDNDLDEIVTDSDGEVLTSFNYSVKHLDIMLNKVTNHAEFVDCENVRANGCFGDDYDDAYENLENIITRLN